MDKAEVLRAIDLDQLEYIQRKIRVDFDNQLQQPVGLHFQGRSHRIEGIICRFGMLAGQPQNGYLVEDEDSNIFCLYYQLENIIRQAWMQPAFWVLSFRVRNNQEMLKWYVEDRKMLVNVSLKRLVDFHGHVCPELVIGSKVCEFVQNLLSERTISASGISIIAENATSALDAIQVLLGVTVGNQRLVVMDYGKHNYTLFSRPRNRGWKLRQNNLHYPDETTFHLLERKISDNEALFEDVVEFQRLVDARIRQIIELPPEALFAIEEVAELTELAESASVYFTCSVCGEQVLASRSIENCKKTLCIPCFRQNFPGCTHFGLQ